MTSKQQRTQKKPMIIGGMTGCILFFAGFLLYIQFGLLMPLKADFDSNEAVIKNLRQQQASQKDLLQDIQEYRDALYGLKLVLEARKNVVSGEDSDNPYLVFDLTRVLNQLRKLIPNDARATAFQMNQSGVITLPIESIDYASLGRVLHIFKEASLDKGGLEFKAIKIPTGAERRIEQSESDGVRRIENLYSLLIQAELNPNFWQKSNSYIDVEEGAYYLPALRDFTDMGAIAGYDDGTFKPNQAISQEEFHQLLLFELLDRGQIKEGEFEAYEPLIEKVGEQSFIENWLKEASFDIDGGLSRLEVLGVLWELYQVEEKRTGSAEIVQLPFVDINKDTPNLSMVQMAYQKGLLDHFQKKFEAEKPVTRAEVVYWMWKLKFD